VKLSEKQLKCLQFYAGFGPEGGESRNCLSTDGTRWSLVKRGLLKENRVGGHWRVHSITCAGRGALFENDRPT
jgi:hypothetical protein